MIEQNFFNMTEIFNDLNPEQKKAVACIEGPLLIMAGAGSGKTRVLTCRIANLIAQGISPFKILAITFTNKAAKEMKDRAEKLIGEPARNIVLSTFHSFCARLLRREIEITGKYNRNFAIFNASDTKSLVKQCIAELSLAESVFSNVNITISDFKNHLIDAEHCAEHISNENAALRMNIQEIYRLYQKKLRENNALDFDDLIFVTVKIFKDYPDVLAKYQERFQYISIDEYQDTNVAQYVLTKLLAAKYKNLCVVGDADQSIYGWRGADMRNILNFEKDYPQARVIKLEQNYRSTKTILSAANEVIKNNRARKPKNLWTENESGEKIIFVSCPDDRQEAAIVAGEVRRLIEKENFQYNEIALLYRTNAQSRLFEERFMQVGIPYIIVGGLKFYDRKEIKDIVAYLHVIANPRDDLHLRRIINVPARGLGSTNVAKLAEFAAFKGLSIFEVVSDEKLLLQVDGLTPRFRAGVKKFAAMMMSFSEWATTCAIDKLIDLVMKESGYVEMLRRGTEDGKRDGLSREENLGEFIDSAKEFVEMNPNATLEDFLNHVALITDLDAIDEKESLVKLMTVHAAKGLEFPVVFVVGMEEELFPHINSLDSPLDLEEERRACYVALTRAKKRLYLTAAEARMFFGNMKFPEVSRFVKEIPEAYVEYYGKRPMPAPKKVSKPKPTYKPPTAHRAAQMTAPVKQSAPPVTFNVGDMINHKLWGMGTVTEVTAKTIKISFHDPKRGEKLLSLKTAPINKV